MEKIKNNWGYIISAILLIIFFVYISFDYSKRKNSLQEFSKNLFYMDTYINVKIYNNDSIKSNNALNEIDKLFKEYHELTDRYNEYDSINNIYVINNNNLDDETLTLDSRLYNLIRYGIDSYNKTNNLININLGNVIDVWKKYRQNENGVPTLQELKNSGSTNIKDIVLLENNQILNNNPNIDLGALAKGYVLQEAANYLEKIGLDKYLINAGGNVVVGNHYNNDYYKIGIENPNNRNDIYNIIIGNNISITTSGDYQRYYECDGKKYHHIIDPNTLYPSEHVKSVTVITKDGALGDMLSTTLFLMSVEDGLEFIKKYSDVEAIWYTLDDEIIKSEGFSNYEQK